MKSLKEKKLLVKMQTAIGEAIDPKLLEEIAEEEARLQTESESRKGAFASIFADLSKDISKLMVEEKKKTAEEQALLDRFSSIVSKIKDAPPVLIEKEEPEEAPVEEIIEPEVVTPEVVEWVEVEVQSPSIASEPVVTKPEPKKKKSKSIVDAAVEHVSETTAPSMFVQPDPPLVNRDIKDIQQKLKLLEGWISKISMNGPGGGAVWLKDLDDVARSSIIGATDGQVLTYNDSIKKWIAATPTAGGTSGNTSQLFAYVTNDENVTIHKGDPVFLHRATGNRPSVILAMNTSDSYSAKVMGLAAEDITAHNPGWVITRGLLTGVSTGAYAEGDTLYVGNTAGSLTNVKPYAPNHLVYMGVVVRANQGQGQIYVQPQNGYELEELHNVNINHNVALANGHTIVYNSTNSLWENRSLSSLVLTYTANSANYIDGIAANAVVTNTMLSSNLANYQTTVGLSANVASLTSNNTLYLGGIAANQYISTTADWVLDGVGISFPNNAGIQTVPFVGDADLLGGIAADQYAYANAIPSIAGLQTTAGLSANVAKLTANNTVYLGGIAANQYAYANSLSSYQTTAGLSANVATLSSNNSSYLGTKAANQYAYANGSNFNINNPVSVSYTGATPTGYALTLAGANTQGGTGYADFLKVTNISTGATANSKSFRLTSSGTLEIINSAYTASILGLSDAGDLSIAGKIQVAGKTAVNGPAFSAYAAAILQTIPSDTQTKVLFQTEEFDTASCYANSRFTPNVEGYYQLNAEVRIDGTSGTGEMMIILYKNGAEYKRGTNQGGTQIAANFWAMQVSSLVYANGTTDYFEIYVQHGAGASRTVTAVNNSAITWFNGSMMRGA